MFRAIGIILAIWLGFHMVERLVFIASDLYFRRGEYMPTIEFTYSKAENCYCFGFWINGKFIVRGKSKSKYKVWEQFQKELQRLERAK